MSTRPFASDDAPRSSLSEQIYAALKSDIHDFRLIPGDRLSEADIGNRMGASRTPVREALFRLRKEGFLEVEPKTGWFVRPLDFAKLEELHDLVAVLELASVARLCARADDGSPTLAALQAAWLAPEAERLTDAHQVSALDEVFHSTLVDSADNAEISRVHREATERIRIMRRLDFTRPDRIAATYDEHAKILRAISTRRADIAQYMLRSHIEQSKAEVRKITLQTLFEAREKARLQSAAV
ncbi:GntR family transcriptional regulator [Aquabacterium sp.]|uniref:GntR family transcriptional regulator n=1 Tax=Aquabacterium sp. TaxID=1872578 RepID=UPI0035B02AE5